MFTEGDPTARAAAHDLRRACDFRSLAPPLRSSRRHDRVGGRGLASDAGNPGPCGMIASCQTAEGSGRSARSLDSRGDPRFSTSMMDRISEMSTYCLSTDGNPETERAPACESLTVATRRALKERLRPLGAGSQPAALLEDLASIRRRWNADCFPFALSKTTQEPLLFRGGVFSRTDFDL